MMKKNLKRSGAALLAAVLAATSLGYAGIVSAAGTELDFKLTQEQKFANPEMEYRPYACLLYTSRCV